MPLFDKQYASQYTKIYNQVLDRKHRNDNTTLKDPAIAFTKRADLARTGNDMFAIFF